MRVFVHPNKVHSDFISPFSNSLPWSLCITSGIPLGVGALCYNMRPLVLDHSVSGSGHYLDTLPSPKLLASVSRTYSPVSVGKASIGASIKAARSSPKAVEKLESHTKGTSLPVKDTNGVATSANLGIHRL